jgi:hypothetical protein
VSLKGEVKGLKVGETVRVGDLVTFDVSVDRIPHIKDCCSHKMWLVLINQQSREVQLVDFRQT